MVSTSQKRSKPARVGFISNFAQMCSPTPWQGGGGGWDTLELQSRAATAEFISQTLLNTFLLAQDLVPSGRLGFGCRRGGTLGGTAEFRPNQPHTACAAASLREWGVRVGTPFLSLPASPAAAPCLPADPGERAHQGGEQ